MSTEHQLDSFDLFGKDRICIVNQPQTLIYMALAQHYQKDIS